MFNLSENYHLRKCFLQREQVPTQSMIREKMSPALAAVYFQSMTPRLKVIAGLEPKLKGGGSIWYAPPEDLLKGRAVLKPVGKQLLSQLNSVGIDNIGKKLFVKHRKVMDLEIEQALVESDDNWRYNISVKNRQLWDDLVAAAIKKNTAQILKDYDKFTYIYRQSMGKIEILFHESAVAEIKRTRENAIQEMQNKYTTVLKHQATSLYDEYEKKLKDEQTRLKVDFMENLGINRTAMTDKIHDLNVDKHMAIESLRQCLQCQNLACGVYVALKEREECSKETEMLEQKHKKKVDIITDEIIMKDFEINLAMESDKNQQYLRNVWRKKVCHVVKSFQEFVSYCLKMLPEHAEFFINMEKLMLLQLDEAIEDPAAASIIEVERDQFHTPVPRPNPFYLVCDNGYKAKVDQDLCPKHSGTSSASRLPVIIVNKRCLYAACDNFEQFSNKIKEFIHGKRGEDADFKDDNVYEHFVPVKYGPSQQIVQIKLQSSLLQLLQQELANLQIEEDKFPGKCAYCALPWCIPCPPPRVPFTWVDAKKIKQVPSSITSSRETRNKLQSVSRSIELDHEREPKWKSLCKYVEPKKCSCAKIAKKHLTENLPVYMQHMKYGQPEIPGYKKCSMKELKSLVKAARKEIHPPAPTAVPSSSRTKDMSTQYCDPIFEEICTCYSDDELTRFINEVKTNVGPKIEFDDIPPTEDDVLPSFMTRRVSSFATSRAQSLRNLMNELSELQNIFEKDDCNFD